jgi:predicted dinucleotide-binding enzyme
VEYLIAAIVLVLAVAFVIAGATGNASSLLSAVTGHTITFGSSTAPSTSATAAAATTSSNIGSTLTNAFGTLGNAVP